MTLKIERESFDFQGSRISTISTSSGAAGRYTWRMARAYVAVVVVEAVVLVALWLLSRHFAA